MADEDRIPTNLRTLLILEVMGRADRSLSPTEINHEIGLPKQTVHRLCATLVEEGFLSYDAGGKKLRPARRARLMGTGLLYASRLHIVRRQILDFIAQNVGETVNYVVPEEMGMNYLDRVETDWAFRVQLPIGTHVPFHCTASGKTFLASMSPAARERMVRGLNLDKRTDNTHIDPDFLLAELAQIAGQGYALDEQEFMDGMVALAVPVLDDKKRFLAAVAIHGPTIRLDTKILHSHLPVMKDAAEKLSFALLSDA